MKKRVRFNDNVIVHEWVDEEDRRSEWMRYARDKVRFQRKTQYLEKLVSPVLEMTHRSKVSGERFLIADIQGFVIPDFKPKELNITDSYRNLHILFKPPVPFHVLPQQVQRTISWLEVNHTNLKYSSGYVDLKHINNILNNVCKFYDKIYVKGHQKCKYLRKHLNLEIINLEDDVNAPTLSKMEFPCFYHRKNNNILSNYCICTEHNVKTIYNYILNKTTTTLYITCFYFISYTLVR